MPVKLLCKIFHSASAEYFIFMPKSKQQKQLDLKELEERLASAKSAVFFAYRGTNVKAIDQVRRALEKEQVSAKVYKLTLLEKAMKARGIQADTSYGVPVVTAVSKGDEVSPIKIVKKFSKEVATLSILGGLVGGEYYDQKQMLTLADLPSKQELLAKLVGSINAPVNGFVNVLAGNLRGLINVLNAIVNSK